MGIADEIQALTDKYTLIGARDPDTDEIKPVNLDDTPRGLNTQLYVWDTVAMDWVKMEQPTISTDTVIIDNTTLEGLVADQLFDYKVDDFDTSGNPVYVGFQKKDGNYYIMRVNTSSGAIDYTKGASGYSTAWTNRATESYSDFASTF